ncbi:hypothetical protein KSD_54370 [Ktedonobacter sp. SOSP1-85]|uniref:hypothetical protein n=1 Tax=Ktedonobacter sp. SOSP1-85 TaxID=2778367 RepID=UPI0019159BCC|nr:hypothetical protein [Ktedonobacter sp. SOSP1-85]GHO77666.1 hypothetical protein KSD_54370 [Ktedonobacter sp. SOSP1-85]
MGLAIAFWRRLKETGLFLTQRFGFDLLPLILLFAICVTGLGLTASSLWWGGQFYWFISLTHQMTVVLWLLMLPFGKFFHIIQRPASIGVTLYQTVNQDVDHYAQHTDDKHTIGTGQCKRCGHELPSEQFIAGLKGVLRDLGQDYTLNKEHDSLHDYCPTCKRLLRGQAYYHMMGKRFL